MPKNIEGVYRNSKIKRSKTPGDVIVTVHRSNSIDLQKHGITKVQASDMRARLASFAEDWNRPEMSVYDNYDEAKAKLQTR